MRAAIPLLALVLASAVAAAPAATPAPRGPIINPQGADAASAVCRDRIHEVRRELGQPALERDAAPAEGLLIAAVDKRVGGCAVMVMRGNTSDLRPLPPPGEFRMMPARSLQGQ